MKRQKIVFSLLTIMVAGGMSACGSSSSTASSPTTEATSPTTSTSPATSSTSPAGSGGGLVLGSTCTGKAASGAPVEIATIVELEDANDGIAGANAAVKSINKCGGINGHPIKFVVCPDNGSVSAATKCANDAVSSSSTLAIGGQASSYGSVVDPIFAKANLAILGLAGPGSDLTTPNFFAAGISLGITEADGVYAVKDLHLDKVGLPYLNLGGFGTAAVAAFKEIVTGPYKAPAAVAVPIDVPETNFPAKAAALSSTNVLVPALDSVRTIPLVQALSQAGETQPIVLNTSVFTSADYKTVASLSPAPVVYDLSPFKLAGPGYEQYEADMRAVGEAGTTSDNAVAINSWITIHNIADVANKIGPSVTRASLLSALSKLKDYNTEGLTPPLNYTLRNPKLPFGNLVNTAVVFYKVTSTGYTPTAGSAFETGLLPSALVP